MIYNPNKLLFNELENFLNYYFVKNIDYPICIHKSQINKPHILYNTEQISRNNIDDLINQLKYNKDIIEIWDYSLANIRILNKLEIYNVKYIPLKIWPDYKDKILSFNIDNTYNYDVGFCGWVHGVRRTNILNQIQKSNITIDIIEDIYGEDRDKRLAKCKIILNVHYKQDYMVFEQLRCFPWLDIGRTVVSESSLDDDPRSINVDYEYILPTLLGLLKK